MKLIIENRFALLGLVVVALAALFGVAQLSLTALPAPAEEAEPVLTRVESAARVCPPPQGGDAEARVAAFAPEGDDGENGGALAAAPNLPDAVPSEPLQEAGRPWLYEPPAGDAQEDEDGGDGEDGSGSATVVRAEGALAAGLEAAQTTVGDSSVSEIRCAEPTSSVWFAAPGGDQLEDLRLHLSNIDETPATVNVDLYATDGPSFSEETRGITVDPRGQVDLSLIPLVETTNAVAVHVRTNAGRAAVGLFAEHEGGGADWVPSTAAPATRHVIPGVQGGGGNKRLVIATPGDEPTTADVRLITPEGEAEEEALASVDVPPAASTRVSLEGPLDSRPGTVVVEADHPVVVGVAMDRSDGDDTAYTAATAPLAVGPDARAVAPPAPRDTGTALLLGAPEEAVEVRLTPVASDGERGEALSVTVEAGTTVVPETDPGGGTTWIVEAVGGGPLHAARALTADGALSVLPLPPAPAEVPLPGVVDSLTSVVP
ncbi:DUF5719 family protein [Actinorugispora endophytica]|uniref:Secreted protein n=1 Tax=Actinorugispora endophytica TaxID=1605990 RepID=A0A4R6UX21_9ACTN|nr:DUF5719 family protein [Actinorugispora endophytica]TDQ51940.1 hypothetical protein EV190_10952 [Actinorugispora endophytica]